MRARGIYPPEETGRWRSERRRSARARRVLSRRSEAGMLGMGRNTITRVELVEHATGARHKRRQPRNSIIVL